MAHGLQGFLGDAPLELLVDSLEVGIGGLPGLATVIGQKNVIHAKVGDRRLPENQVLFFHGLYQSGQGRFRSVGDECEVILNQPVLVMQVFQYDELFL